VAHQPPSVGDVVDKATITRDNTIKRLSEQADPRRAVAAFEERLGEYTCLRPNEESGEINRTLPFRRWDDLLGPTKPCSVIRVEGEWSVDQRVSTLGIIGAGPKGLAIAAKADALRRVGLDVPDIIIFEADEPGSHWRGGAGYTDGLQPLGTAPDKDLGFPYLATRWSPDAEAVNAAMRQVSWPAFLCDGTSPFASFENWIDQGRPTPRHDQWAAYLAWAADRIQTRAGTAVVKARVTGLTVEGDQWRVSVHDGTTHVVDALVVTGPGEPLGISGDGRLYHADEDRVHDGRSFWRSLIGARLGPTWPDEPVVCVVGAGETAASVVVGLLRHFGPDIPIDLVARSPFIYSRGESFHESRISTAPRRSDIDWRDLSASARATFITRTDRGVISPAALATIASATAFRVIEGEVIRAESDHGGDGVWGSTVRLKNEPFARNYAHTVLAHGFDPLSILHETADQTVFDRLCFAVETSEWRRQGRTVPELERKAFRTALGEVIGPNLEVLGMRPWLHIPNLAGLEQGPGFPTLSSLGLLADRVLSPHVSRPRPPRPDTPRGVLQRAS
jgi:mycobactin lysine-N-oxygenase